VQRTRDVPAEVRTRAAENPTDIEAQQLVADVDLMGGHVEDAFARLITTIQLTAGDDRDEVRKHLLELFEVVGADDERVVKARRRLMAALF
jgi:putative thioredoxin